MNRPPRGSTLFPYTTLFRSAGPLDSHAGVQAGQQGLDLGGARLRQVGLAQHDAVRDRGLLGGLRLARQRLGAGDRKSTRLNSSHVRISYAVFCLKKKKK